jgi:hypothetical protein
VPRLVLVLVAAGILAAAARADAMISSVTRQASSGSATVVATPLRVAVTAAGDEKTSRGGKSRPTKLMKRTAGGIAVGHSRTNSTAGTASSSTPSPDGRWYSPASAFNQPIPRGTPFRPNDASLISALVNVAGRPLGPNLSAAAVYFADANTPTVTVHDNFPACDSGVFKVPIPPGAKSPSELNKNNLEPKMVVMQRGTGIEWSMFKATAPSERPLSSGSGPRCPRNGDWNATIVTKFDPASGAGGWRGLANEACCSGSASQIYYPAGLVRPRDVRSKGPTWGHALSMSYGGILNAYVYPAKDYGGFCRDVGSCVPAGARFQLDPGFDCARTRLLVYRWERQACRTMQVYGMIAKDTPCVWPCRGVGYDTANSYSVRLPIGRYVDGGGSYQFPFDSSRGHREMPVEILRHFHVIDWTKWTGAEILFGAVGRSGSVSLRNARGQRIVRVRAGSYLLTVQDRSRAYGFRLIGPRRAVLPVSGEKYVGSVRRRVRLVRGTYRYASEPGSAASRATFTVR